VASIDQSVVRWLNHRSQHQPLRAVVVISAKYLAIVPPLILVGVFLWALWRRDAGAAAKAGLAGAATLLAVAANQVVGNVVHRVRPYTAIASVHAIGSRGGDSSFYSDHTALAAGAAIGVMLLSRRWGIAAVGAAALVAMGRVAVGAHYPTDVLAAAAAAGFAVWLLQLLRSPVERVLARFVTPRSAPVTSANPG